MQVKVSKMPVGLKDNPDLQKVLEQHPERVAPILERIKKAIQVTNASIHHGTDQFKQPFTLEAMSKLRACAMQVAAVYPDICPDFMCDAVANNGFQAKNVIKDISEGEKKGLGYPKRSLMPDQKVVVDGLLDPKDYDTDDKLKALWKFFDNPERRTAHKSTVVIAVSLAIIRREFPVIPRMMAHKLLNENGDLILPTYLDLEQFVHGWDKRQNKPKNLKFRESDIPPYSVKDTPTIPDLFNSYQYARDPRVQALLPELQAGRIIRAARDAKRQADKALPMTVASSSTEATQKAIDQAPREVPQKAFQEPTEKPELCKSCLDKTPNVVHCQAKNQHVFCVTCATFYGKNDVVADKEVKCMSSVECHKGFSHAERAKFLDDKELLLKSDLAELGALLVKGRIKNLEVCGFCDFVAQSPKVSYLKTFTCLDRECSKKTCRVCRNEATEGHECEIVAINLKMDKAKLDEEASGKCRGKVDPKK